REGGGAASPAALERARHARAGRRLGLDQRERGRAARARRAPLAAAPRDGAAHRARPSRQRAPDAGPRPRGAARSPGRERGRGRRGGARAREGRRRPRRARGDDLRARGRRQPGRGAGERLRGFSRVAARAEGRRRAARARAAGTGHGARARRRRPGRGARAGGEPRGAPLRGRGRAARGGHGAAQPEARHRLVRRDAGGRADARADLHGFPRRPAVLLLRHAAQGDVRLLLPHARRHRRPLRPARRAGGDDVRRQRARELRRRARRGGADQHIWGPVQCSPASRAAVKLPRGVRRAPQTPSASVSAFALGLPPIWGPVRCSRAARAALLTVGVLVLLAARVRLVAPAPTLLLRDAHGRFLAEVPDARDPEVGYWPLARLPPRVVAATLAVEDRRFWRHPGVDPLAVVRGVGQNLRAGRRASGASTIAMQVARLERPGPRTYPRKLIEALAALALTARYGHAAVLAHYLRIAPYGNRVRGIAYAARRYLEKPVEDLSWAETAFLAAIPQAPARMNPYREPGRTRAAERGRRILDALLAARVLGRDEYDLAVRQIAALRIPPLGRRPPEALHAVLHLE